MGVLSGDAVEGYAIGATAECRILLDNLVGGGFGGFMQRVERLVAIHETLRRAAPRRVSAARLAEEFGVSRRTIERDMATLQGAGVPLYAERGRNGGHVTLDQVGNVVVTLSPAEVTALLVAVAAAGPMMPYADAGTSAINRLLDGLPPTTRMSVETLRHRIRSHALTAERSHRRIRQTIEAAVQRAVIVNIAYRDANSARTQRAVEAHGFFQGSDGWFLIGWCTLRDAGRIFRLDRIERAHLTKSPNPHRDLDETLGWVPSEVAVP